MRREPPRSAADYAPLVFPALMLVVFFVAPFSIMIAVSFFKRNPAGFYTPDFVFDNGAPPGDAVATLAADFLYSVLNPRIRLGGEQ